ncbi:MAG TPA: hypothetical protein PK177_02375 [Burkholderiaceae bacterium]|nr:hypothetical protein [Burkholderiaceae bacterium]
MSMPPLLRAVLAGSVASLASTAAIVLSSRVETNHPASGTNATSQWLFGEHAARKNRASLKHTVSGYAIHHAMSIFWALLYERHRRRPDRLHGCLRDAALTALLAAFVDFRMMPSRFTPGFEKRLSRKALLAVYAAYSAGLGVGSWAMIARCSARDGERRPSRAGGHADPGAGVLGILEDRGGTCAAGLSRSSQCPPTMHRVRSRTRQSSSRSPMR